MKKLLLLLLIAPVLGFAQGEQRYADGTATDQDGNTFEWINYGDLDWAIENANVTTYTDGTQIPNETDIYDFWRSDKTGAWIYYDNDSSNGRLYNWYAVTGKHDGSDSTPNKQFAPDGWRVPSNEDWENLLEYLHNNGYHLEDGTPVGDPDYVIKLAKAMSSTTGWENSDVASSPGDNQNTNNKSGFNAYPEGWLRYQFPYMDMKDKGLSALFWSTNYAYTTSGINYELASTIPISGSNVSVGLSNAYLRSGLSVRFVRDASTSSTKDYTDAITIYPNPTTSIVTLQGGKQYDIEVYTLQGKKVMALTGNTIDMSHLSSATYIVKAFDKVENEEVSYKVVKN